jgi:hypothetical protein
VIRAELVAECASIDAARRATPPVRAVAPAAASRAATGLAGLGLAALAAVMCVTHIRHGGFYFDDWGMLSVVNSRGPGGSLHQLWQYYGQRPGEVLYYAFLSSAFGYHAHAQLAFAALVLVVEATCLFAVLRRLRLDTLDAALMAALALAFPFSDSAWLWSIVSMATLSVALSLLGVLIALRAFEHRGRRALTLHAVSVGLYLAAVLSYEVFATVGCLVGLLYAREVGWRRARARWALDAIAIVAAVAATRLALPIDIATPSHTQSLLHMARHAGAMVIAGAQLAGAAAAPFALVDPWVGAGMLALAALAGVAGYRRLPATSDTRATLGRWLKVAGAGATLALAAWAIYVPAIDYYSPAAAGTGNRVNVLAGAGVVLLVYACSRLVGTLLARLVARRMGVSPAVVAGTLAAVTAVALGIGYLQRTAGDARRWDASAADQRQLLATFHAALPRPPHDATLFAFDYPLTIGTSVPVLNTTLDLTSAIRWSYADRSLVGVPIGGSTRLVCGPTALYSSADGPAHGARYGRTLLIDVGDRRAVRVSSRTQCAAAASATSSFPDLATARAPTLKDAHVPPHVRLAWTPATPPRAGTPATPSESSGSKRG